MKRMQQGTQAILPPDCGKRGLDATPPEALRLKEDVDVVSGEAGETARSEAQDLS